MKYTIFSIDKQSSPIWVNAFVGWFRSFGGVGEIVPVIGCYKGETEVGFICHSDDFDKYVWGTLWVSQQESVMRVSECNKQYAKLEYGDFGIDKELNTAPVNYMEGLGSLRCVTEEVAKAQDGWTYRPDLGQYWVAVEGNPDIVYQQESNMRDNMNKAPSELKRAIFTLALAVVLYLVLVVAGSAQTTQNCAPRGDVIERLAEGYGETRQSMGLGTNSALVEQYANTDTGSWTITVTAPGGLTCLVASGQSYEGIEEELPAQGDPT